jgi:phosphoenolpyruvate synthase/pyruvate phosphate dikinase
MESEDRKDIEFRMNLLFTEIGDIAKYVTHDPVLNPGARPHGTPKDEALAYGQVFAMLFASCQLRGIDVEKSIELGLKNWEDRDWRKREASAVSSRTRLIGIGVNPGGTTGPVYVLSEEHPIDKMPEGVILVAKFAKADLTAYMHKIVALVTDHGGATSHAGILATQNGLLALLGTGVATSILQHGEMISLTVPTAGHGAEGSIIPIPI